MVRLLSLLLLLCAACSPKGFRATQQLKASDLEAIAGIEEHDPFADISRRTTYFKLAEPDPEKIRPLFLNAAEEFEVPADLLMAIAQVETNWTQVGPSIDRGWGVMHLVENAYADTLGQGADILGVTRDVLKNDAAQNIRAGAALLRAFAGKDPARLTRLEDWWDAAKKLSGLSSEDLQELQTQRYFKALRDGVQSPTYYGKAVTLAPHAGIVVPMRPAAYAAASADYPEARASFTTCNFTAGRKQKIDVWTNHYIGTGTYAGAISWFKNCSAKASAHFVISKDGEISQVVATGDTAWHAGASASPTNNSRSIGVEHEATDTHPEYWQSEAMLQASAKMARYFAEKHGIPKVHVTDGDFSKLGIRGHREMPGTSTSCPGTLPWDKWMGLLTAQTPAPNPAPAPPSVPVKPEGLSVTLLP